MVERFISRGATMTSSRKKIFTTMAMAASLLAGSLSAQQAPAAPAPSGAIKAEHQIGFESAKDNVKGTLGIQNGSLQFTHDKESLSIPVKSIEEVFTGADSQKTVGGTLGTLTMLAPYGGGRVVSMFRNKVDIIILQYRDANGGFHGCIFTLAQGASNGFKKELIAAGAHASMPVEPEMKDAKPAADKAKDKK